MNYEGLVLGHAFNLVKGNANPETALADGSYPASGSFVDVSGSERFHILIDFGALADDVVFTLQYSTAINGSLTTATHPVTGATIAFTAANASDDSRYASFTVETANLGVPPVDNIYVTLTVSGVVGSNYAGITYLLQEREVPVTQTIMPDSNIVIDAG